MNVLDRRAFLEKLVLASAALGVGGIVAPNGRAASQRASLLDTRIDPSVGELYLAARPEERDLDLLSRKLFGVDAAKAQSLSAEALRQTLVERVRSDFADGAVESVNGWRLARSECRYFGIQALLAR